jgi:crooked neck
VFPYSSNAWTSYADFEGALCEVERARILFDLAVSQEELDMPEVVWKKYIDFEIA